MVTRPTVHLSLRRRCAAVTASVLACGGIAIFAVAAGAAPQPTVSQVQAKIDKLTTQENVAGQQYDQTVELPAGQPDLVEQLKCSHCGAILIIE